MHPLTKYVPYKLSKEEPTRPPMRARGIFIRNQDIGRLSDQANLGFSHFQAMLYQHLLYSYLLLQ